jgi:AbrB family looped-hinge helix DNA binding protein
MANHARRRMAPRSRSLPLPLEQRIHVIRGMTVMLDRDLADLSGVTTKVLLQAVRRNSERFPSDFFFPRVRQELAGLRSQIVASKLRMSAVAVRARTAWRSLHFHGMIHAMKIAMDSAGRIVVPKALRQALDLKPGQPLEIRAGDGRLEIEVAPTPLKLQKRGKSVVAVPSAPLPTLTADEVRATLERVRR